MNTYLQQRTLFAPLINNKASINLGIIVVIPAFDEPDLLFSLMSLARCELPLVDVEVIVVINNSEQSSEEVKERNQAVFLQAREWAKTQNRSRFKFQLLYVPDFPAKSAGVGLARKVGMDEACWRFMKIGNPNGIIACFDADSRCAPNYFQALEGHFQAHPKSQACSIYFEHPTNGIDFPDSVYEAIIPYELHLRYYIHAQRMAGFPYAYHTVGSSMAVRCMSYQRQGGMNRRKAGEDFYFIHKFTPLGDFTECLSTKVIPSPRPSHRVPFGTGRAVQEILGDQGVYFSYNLQSFLDLKVLFQQVDHLFGLTAGDVSGFLLSLPDSIKQFLTEAKFEDKWQEIKRNTASASAFRSRFFRWFNAFMLMKYVHFARDHFYPNIEIGTAAAQLLMQQSKQIVEPNELKLLLKRYRQLDQQSFAAVYDT